MEQIPVDIKQADQDHFFNLFIQKVKQNLFDTKKKEYAPDSKRFINFEIGRALMEFNDIATIFRCYAVKHLASIIQLGDKITKDQILEKYGDLYTYLILLFGRQLVDSRFCDDKTVDMYMNIKIEEDLLAIFTVDRKQKIEWYWKQSDHDACRIMILEFVKKFNR